MLGLRGESKIASDDLVSSVVERPRVKTTTRRLLAAVDDRPMA